MSDLTLNHNNTDSLIRRPSGLTDSEWNQLIVETTDNLTDKLLDNEDTSFLIKFVKVLKTSSFRGTKAILKSLGDGDISYQNWEHTAYRFFRHFCTENFRNAINHAGMPFARLVCDKDGFRWESKLEFKCISITELLLSIGAKLDDTVSVIATGRNDVESVKISCKNDSLEYYSKGITKSFGNTMYLLKRTIIENTPKRRVS